jgi:hypothetical protein
MDCTEYFKSIRQRSDWRMIRDEWIEAVIADPERKILQKDGRIRRWRRIPDAGGRALRVVLLADGRTVHNAFFDRSYAQ